jgi:hypothetical protein
MASKSSLTILVYPHPNMAGLRTSWTRSKLSSNSFQLGALNLNLTDLCHSGAVTLRNLNALFH